MNFGGKGETLSDLLGDIPMDRVKNYSIKSKKGWKRIVIDVEDPPLMEKRGHRQVMIIGDPTQNHHMYRHGMPNKNVEKRIIIRKNNDVKEEGKEEEKK